MCLVDGPGGPNRISSVVEVERKSFTSFTIVCFVTYTLLALILFPKAFRTQRKYFQQIRRFDSRALLRSECANEQS